MAISKQEKIRLDKQRLRSAANRARRKADGKPSHEDLARAVLDIVLTRCLKKGRNRELNAFLDLAADRLAEIGFDRKATESVWLALEDRYQIGWSMLRRRGSQEGLEEFLRTGKLSHQNRGG